MFETNPKVDEFINNASKWRNEYEKLRAIALDSEMKEEMKWGVPCYTIQGRNVFLIHGFKEYCAVLFIKGALLQDRESILIQQTENVQSGRQVRFTTLQEIEQLESVLKSYIQEAIAVEKSGVKVPPRENTQLVFPSEFQSKLDSSSDLKKAFENLTPGRQRAYNLYFSEPKQSKTRETRVENSIPKILAGKGLYD